MDTIFDYGKINWGPDEAKGDLQLQNYFLKIPDYDRLIEGKKRFIIGRKGTGKTAILQKIIIDSKSNPAFFVRELTLKEFPISDLRSLRDKSMQDKSQYVNIWSFLILIELSKLSLIDEGVSNIDTFAELQNFIRANFPNELGGFVDTVKLLKRKESKVSILKSLVEMGNSDSKELIVNIHYSKVITFLKERITRLNTNSSYFILFDELDEGYKVSDTNKRLLLLSLFRAVENLALELKNTNLRFRPIIALRSDIFDNLEDNDLNKYDDYLVRLEWQSINEFNYSLKELINVRIRASLDVNGIDERINPWKLVAIEKDTNIRFKNKSLWAYILNRTFERPRDVIKFLKYCGEIHKGGKLNAHTVFEAEKKYSGWFYREFRDEIQSHLSIWKVALSSLQKIGKRILEYPELRESFLSESEIESFLAEQNIDVDDLVEILFDFGVVGNLSDNKRWIFKYKDHDYRFNPTKKIMVHFGFHKKLLLSNGVK